MLLNGSSRSSPPDLERSFETIFKHHYRPLLSYCRHILGNREEAEDALQQAFIRAHRALRSGTAPRELRPWLYAIARNCCLSAIAARRPVTSLADDALDRNASAVAGLAEEVRLREDLRELLAGIARLPEDQRSALLLAELDDLSHREIATVVGCPMNKVKALVYQARRSLIADREARDASCLEIREQLSVARAGELRRGPLRRHLRLCEGCREFQLAVAAQRRSFAVLLPVTPSAGLLAAIAGHGAAHAAGAGMGVGTATGAGATGAGAGAGATGASVAGTGTSAATGAGSGAVGAGGASASAGLATTGAVAGASTGAGGGASVGAMAGGSAAVGVGTGSTTSAVVGGGALAKLAVGGAVAVVAAAGAGTLAVHRHQSAPSHRETSRPGDVRAATTSLGRAFPSRAPGYLASGSATTLAPAGDGGLRVGDRPGGRTDARTGLTHGTSAIRPAGEKTARPRAWTRRSGARARALGGGRLPASHEGLGAGSGTLPGRPRQTDPRTAPRRPRQGVRARTAPRRTGSPVPTRPPVGERSAPGRRRGRREAGPALDRTSAAGRETHRAQGKPANGMQTGGSTESREKTGRRTPNSPTCRSERRSHPQTCTSTEKH